MAREEAKSRPRLTDADIGFLLPFDLVIRMAEKSNRWAQGKVSSGGAKSILS
jgi:hypothetical protein